MGTQKNAGKGFTLRQKMVFIMLPVIIIFNLITFIITVSQTRKIMHDNADEHIREVATSVGHQISADLMMTKGLLQNVKNSVEKSCSNEEEIRNLAEQCANSAADMASRSEEQSASTSNALDDCRQMIEIAEQFNREGTEVENSGRELKELSLKLDETVEKFRV